MTSPSSSPSSASVPASLNAMIGELEEGALREVALLLGARLISDRSAQERREEELGFLAAILDQPEAMDPRSARSTPKRDYYDAHRPAMAPLGQRLCERYGSWTKACRAARGLTGLEPGARPWTHGFTGKRRPLNYTRDEAVRAVLRCAAELGRLPSSHAYYTWAARQRREAKEKGAVPRLPLQRSIERHFSSWSAVTEAVLNTLES